MNRIALAVPAIVVALFLGGCSGDLDDSAPTYGAESPTAEASAETGDGQGQTSADTTESASGATSAEPTTPQDEETEPAGCSGLSAGEALDRWIGEVPRVDDWAWDAEWAESDGYDDCAALSWIVLPIEGGTGSSPYQIMLCHQGEYLGTATAKAYGFAPEVSRVDDRTIAVTYRFAKDGDINANPTGRAEAQFTWSPVAEKVVMTGQVPDDR